MRVQNYKSLPWIVLVVSLLATAASWYELTEEVQERNLARFALRTTTVAEAISDRLSSYELILKGGIALFRSSQDVTRREWQTYVHELDVNRNLPGIQGIGFSMLVAPQDKEAHITSVRAEGLPNYKIYPEGERSPYTSIVYLEPFDWRNQRAFGFDMFSEPVRREAMERARDTGKPVISGMVRLVQETEQDIQSGFLLYLPLYRNGTNPNSQAERRQSIIGYVYSPFRMGDFMQAVAGAQAPLVALTIYDGSVTADSAIIFRDGAAVAQHTHSYMPAFARTIQLPLFGHVWTLEFTSTPRFEERLTTYEPHLLLIGGVLICSMLFGITWLLTHDLLNLQQMQSSLGATQQKLRAVFENAPLAVYLRELDGRFALANNRYAQMYNVDLKAVLGKRIHDFAESNRADQVTSDDRRLLEKKEINQREREVVMPGGEKRVFLNMKYLIPDEAGNPTAICGIGVDITERKQAEQQLHHLQKIEGVGRLTGGIAHDFNNLLQIILGNCELGMGVAKDRPVLLKYLRSVLSAGKRGADLTRRLLAFSSQQMLEPKAVALNDVVNGMKDMIHRTLGEDIEISAELEEPSPTTYIDVSQLETAILNLAINARHAMPNGGALVIETRAIDLDESYVARVPFAKSGHYSMLSVSDTGTGMSPETVDHAFEPFFTTKEQGKGTGLGLSIVYGFVKQSGGHVNIYSELGYGTTVRMYLPPARTDDAEVQPATKSPTSVDDYPRGTETILVVEDDPDVRAYVLDQLKALGYRVIEVKDGRAALIVTRRVRDIDLVFTDIVMPGGMSGADLARELQRERSDLKVLFTSGYSEHIALRGTGIYGSSILSKPYSAETLAKKIRSVLDRENEGRPG